MNIADFPGGLGDGLHRVVGDDGMRYVVKVRRRAPAGFFEAEARGLDALRATRTLRVPEIHLVRDDVIAIEDLGSGQPRNSDWERAGAALARLHETTGTSFGFDGDGWCGDTAQDNARCSDGYRFFAERRLQAQARIARDRGLIETSDAQRVDRLCDRLPELIPTAPPVLIHGDLWTGNLHACANGELALIDGGAVHYGWAEADLSMLILFGEPPSPFFGTYATASGANADWRERAPLYNLYHLLNHLNLFGSGYVGAVRGVLRRY